MASIIKNNRKNNLFCAKQTTLINFAAPPVCFFLFFVFFVFLFSQQPMYYHSFQPNKHLKNKNSLRLLD